MPPSIRLVQANPLTAVESTLRKLPDPPTANSTGVDPAEAATMLPLPVSSALGIAASTAVFTELGVAAVVIEVEVVESTN